MFSILDASVPEQRAKWLAEWQNWPDREVAAHPDYVRLFARPDDRSLCAVMRHDGGAVLFPFIQRDLSVEPWAAGYRGMCDLTSPYGYGGAFASGAAHSEAVASMFWDSFDAWAHSVSAVSSFVRASLFQDQIIATRGETMLEVPNVVRTLRLEPDAIWADYAHKVRKNIKAARRAGLQVRVDLTGERLGEFLSIYYATMERRGASGSYYFPAEFFDRIISDLRSQFAFFHVSHEGTIVSTELVLVSAQHLYSFLGGTLPEAFHLRANDLLKHAVIEWGRELGKKAYVLGGGYAIGDGIFRYKLSFAPNGQAPMRLVVRVYDEAVYDAFVQARQAWETHAGRSWIPRADFFPAYRA